MRRIQETHGRTGRKSRWTHPLGPFPLPFSFHFIRGSDRFRLSHPASAHGPSRIVPLPLPLRVGEHGACPRTVRRPFRFKRCSDSWSPLRFVFAVRARASSSNDGERDGGGAHEKRHGGLEQRAQRHAEDGATQVRIGDRCGSSSEEEWMGTTTVGRRAATTYGGAEAAKRIVCETSGRWRRRRMQKQRHRNDPNAVVHLHVATVAKHPTQAGMRFGQEKTHQAQNMCVWRHGDRIPAGERAGRCHQQPQGTKQEGQTQEHRWQPKPSATQTRPQEVYGCAPICRYDARGNFANDQ